MDCENSYKIIAKLESDLEMTRANVAEMREKTAVKVKSEAFEDDALSNVKRIESLCEENSQIMKEKESLENFVKQHSDQINHLETKNQNLENIVIKLNTELSENRA